MMMLKDFIQKQYFIVNFDTQDIADVIHWNEGKTKEEILAEDMQYMDKLLDKEALSLERLEGSTATIGFDRDERALYITLDINDKKYKLSLLEFLEYEKYKKLRSYFLADAVVAIKDVSFQIGGVVDRNYGIKFKISL